MSPSIQEVKNKHTNYLINLPGVVSVGIGRDSTGNPAIVIGLDEFDPRARDKIPLVLDGYPVVIEIIGTIDAQ